MRLNTEEWKWFNFDEFFDEIIRGKRLIASDREPGNLPYFSASESNNGLTDNISNPIFIERDAIVYSTFGDCYYVEGEFTASDEISILKLNDLNVPRGLFIAIVIQQNKFKYAYGRKAFQNKFIKEKFKLPIVYTTDQDGNKTPKIDPTHKHSEEGYIPDFEYMENYINSLHHKPLTTIVNKDEKKLELKVDEWMEFRIGDLFNLEPGKCSNSSELIDGLETYYMGAKKTDNGIMRNVQTVPELISNGNCIVFIGQGEGSSGYSNYMNKDFIAATSLTLGYSDFLNDRVGLFMVSILDLEYDKYSFGRSWKGERLENTTIKLPILKDQSGQPKIDPTHRYSKDGYIPDFEFMEEYIKGLPYGDRV